MKARVSRTQSSPSWSVERLEIGLTGRRKGFEEAVGSFEDRARTKEATTRHQGGANPRLSRKARMHSLRPGPFGKIFDDACGHAAGDAEGGDRCSLVKAQCGGDGAGGGNRPDYRRWVEPCLVNRLWRNQAQSAKQFDARRDANEETISPSFSRSTRPSPRGR